jgi:hypothetical protein
MIFSGIKDLASVAVTAPLTGSVVTQSVDAQGQSVAYVDRLEGMLAAAIEFRLAYGSGGTTVKAYLQTSFDQGQTWFDIACAAFTTSSAVKLINLSALTPKTTQVTPTDGSLTDDTCVDGLIGDRLRVKVTSTGTYVNTQLAVRAVVR